MKKVLLAVVLVSFFTACKKKTPSGNTGNLDISTLDKRLPGDWDIVRIEYFGIATLPSDTSVRLPFTGEGESVTGYYKFDTIPNPNMMDFLMSFSAPLDFDSGLKLTLQINEEGYATYEVNEDESLLEGISYVIQPSGVIDTVPSEWTVIENQVDRQVWRIEKVFYWDDDPNVPIFVDMTTTIEK